LLNSVAGGARPAWRILFSMMFLAWDFLARDLLARSVIMG